MILLDLTTAFVLIWLIYVTRLNTLDLGRNMDEYFTPGSETWNRVHRRTKPVLEATALSVCYWVIKGGFYLNFILKNT